MHHGRSFHDEVERLGGVGAQVMFQHKEAICRQWPELVQSVSGLVEPAHRDSIPSGFRPTVKLLDLGV